VPTKDIAWHAGNWWVNSVVKGTTTFYVISFNHRLAFVKASDVDVVS
jgi:hypothetical protein